MHEHLIVFAKAPIPGKVKTRLIPNITPNEAAYLYKAFILDIVCKIRELKCSKITIAYTPHSAEKEFLRLGGKSMTYLPQKGRNLGERMKNAFNQSFAEGAKEVIIIGTDSPTLPMAYIKEAFGALRKVPIVIGPTFDGGYYLIGLSRPNNYILSNIRWSTSSVFDQTLERVKSQKSKFHVLSPWYDVDTPNDLTFLRSHLLAMKMSGENEIPGNTTKFLKV